MVCEPCKSRGIRVRRIIGSDRIRKNITIGNRRTSVSLEEQVWEGLTDICRREGLTIDGLCTAVDARRKESSMSSSLRVFLLTYFRLVTETMEEQRDSPRPGFAHPPQHPFPSYFEIALERFDVDQRRHATG